MTHREPCHISDGPRDPDDAIPGLDSLGDDEDRAYENRRQDDIDSLNSNLKDIARSAA